VNFASTLTATAPGALDHEALHQLFRAARTHNAWLDRPVPDALLREAIGLAKMGPTAANSQPMRVVFVRSAQAKERLKPALAPGNVDKTMQAPVTAIVGYDLGFPDLLPRLFPHADVRASFAGKDALIAALPIATARSRAAISSWRCARWVSTWDRCRASIRPWSTPRSSQAPRFAATS